MEFKDRLMELRKSRGWSQEELGDKLDVTRQTVSKWELGQTTPEMNKLAALSELFGISLDELIAGKVQKTDKEVISDKDVIYIKYRKHYEYKSKSEIMGLPLVHINLGDGMYRAKGILAIGNIATGILAVGGIAFGVLSIGGFAVGLLALAGLALGILSLGGLSAGVFAAGGIAVGYFAAGGLAAGIYSMGGCAIADRIAAGGYARGYIAVGESVNGILEFTIKDNIKNFNVLEFKNAVLDQYPDTWKFILDLYLMLLN